LVRWLRSGLIGLHRSGGPSETVELLSEGASFVLLDRYEHWASDGPAVHLHVTDVGAAAPDDEWLAASRDS
jgi:hypothetical protein